jgi:hypothetical protein
MALRQPATGLSRGLRLTVEEKLVGMHIPRIPNHAPAPILILLSCAAVGEHQWLSPAEPEGRKVLDTIAPWALTL